MCKTRHYEAVVGAVVRIPTGVLDNVAYMVVKHVGAGINGWPHGGCRVPVGMVQNCARSVVFGGTSNTWFRSSTCLW